MRDQILNIIDTVIEGMNFVCTASENDSLDMVENCSIAILSIVESLSQSLSEERFKYYGELFNKVQGMIEKFKATKEKKKIDDIVDLLNIIKKQLMNEKEVKTEVLFLPYKASMWDSLESIWLAAKDDERCNVAVVPIPYFDRNPDGTLANAHYEGDLFPKYVPVISYQKYDISKFQPDIIYFHNPYDDYNKVTMVHPKFFSSELKKYTSMLVYVPYYMSNNTVSDDFIKVPGAVNADRIIVQSEEMAKIYKKYFPEEKILTLGTPKIDKILTTKKENIDIPEEWKKKIQNKKVIFYNTHLVSIMSDPYKFLAKLKYVFSCFENREDVILLWRPHPLSKETINSMQPAIKEEYYRIETAFRNKEWGIFDDTSDINRAIALSDAYLGDATSSIVPMYGITGKPILIQNLYFDRGLSREYFIFEDIYVDGEDAYFSDFCRNGLIKGNLLTGETELVATFPNEFNRERLYCTIERYNNKLIFAPENAKEISIYDMDKKEFEKIKIKDENCDYKFLMTVKYKNYIFFIPSKYPAIIRLNLDTNEISYIDNWYKDNLAKNIKKDGIDIFNRDTCILGNEVYLTFYLSNVVMRFNMDTLSYNLYEVGNKDYKYSGISYDGEYFWLAPQGKLCIIKWNMKNNFIEEIDNFPNDHIEGKLGAIRSFYENGNLFIFPRDASSVIKIDTKTNNINKDKLFEDNEILSPLGEMFKFFFVKKIENRIYAFSQKSLTLMVYDTEKNDMKHIKFRIPENINQDRLPERNKNISDDFMYHEGFGLQLTTFIDAVSNNYSIDKSQIETFGRVAVNSDGSAGVKIHKKTISESINIKY